MAELDVLARDLTEVDERARRLSSRAELLGAEPELFGGDGPGRLGEVGRALAAQHRAALAARRSEAGRIGAVAAELSGAVDRAAVSYRDVEDRRAATR
jgi:hypothetical protein